MLCIKKYIKFSDKFLILREKNFEYIYIYIANRTREETGTEGYRKRGKSQRKRDSCINGFLFYRFCFVSRTSYKKNAIHIHVICVRDRLLIIIKVHLFINICSIIYKLLLDEILLLVTIIKI